MAHCQKCGAENPPRAAVCHECGSRLNPKSALAGTMVGMPSPLAAPQPQDRVASDEPRPPGQPGAQERAPLGGTMIGMPSPLAPQDPGAGQGVAAMGPPAGTAQPEPNEGDQVKRRALGQTMVGLGLSAPQHHAAGQYAPPPRISSTQKSVAPSQPGEAPPAGERNPKFAGTLLGIAQPGIAPSTQPGAPPAQGEPRAAGAMTSPPPSSGRRSYYSSRPAPRRIPTTKSPWSGAMMIVGGMIVAAGIGGTIAVFAPKPVTVVVSEFAIDDQGNDRLRVRCAGCEDGDTLVLGEAKGTVEGTEAVIQPESPLKLGRNELSFHLLTKSGEKKEAKTVILPVAFRVLTSWEGRHENPPYAVVTVAAPNDTKVSISGTDVPVENERAVHRIPFEKESLGESKSIESVSAEVPVEVVVDGKKRTAQAELKSGLTPLTLTSPAPVHRLGGKAITVEGITSAEAKVIVNGKPISADEHGHFRTEIENPRAGQLVILAQGKDLLTRRVTLQLEKSTKPAGDAVSRFSEIAVGSEVSLVGNVLESRISDGTTRALVEIESGCDAPPCLLRAVYGEPLKLKPNRAVKLSGRASGGSPMTVRTTSFQ